MKKTLTPIKGYEGLYEMSVKGAIISTAKTYFDSMGRKCTQLARKISTRIDKRSGYPVVKLTKPSGKYGTQYIHRLVALTLISKPPDKNLVNHKNSNRLDYRVSNLEWVTSKENYKHAVKDNLVRYSVTKKVLVKDLCTGEQFESIKEAAKVKGLNYNKCKLMLNGHLPNFTCLERED